jgi:hypothetical protein
VHQLSYLVAGRCAYTPLAEAGGTAGAGARGAVLVPHFVLVSIDGVVHEGPRHAGGIEGGNHREVYVAVHGSPALWSGKVVRVRTAHPHTPQCVVFGSAAL